MKKIFATLLFSALFLIGLLATPNILAKDLAHKQTYSRTHISDTIHNNAENNLNSTLSTLEPGYYRVIDVYPSGKKVVRDTAPIGTRLQTKRKTGFRHPLSADNMWFSEIQAAYVYSGKYGSVYKNFMFTLDDEAEVQVSKSWTRHFGTWGYAASIDYGFDCYEDLIVANEDNDPILVNSTNGETIYQFPLSNDAEWVINVVSGDLDGDAGVEIVFLCKNMDTRHVYLRILDDWQNNFEDIKQIDLTDIIPSSIIKDGEIKAVDTDLDLYDIDRDGRMEIFVAPTIKIEDGSDLIYRPIGLVFDDKNENFVEIAELLEPDSVTADQDDEYYADRYINNLVIGDMDGDGEYELVMMYFYMHYYQYNSTTKKIEYLGILAKIKNIPWIMFGSVKALAYDIDLDYQDELIILSCIEFDNNAGMIRFEHLKLNQTNITEYYQHSYRDYDEGSVSKIYGNIAVGDFDGDLFPELAYTYTLYFLSSSRCGKYVYFYDDYRHAYDYMDRYRWYVDYEAPRRPIILPVALNGRIFLHYMGIHNQSMSFPYIMAVMAAPPTIAGISQNYDGTSTLFGTSVTHTYSKSNGYTVSAGVTISVEAEDPFGVFKAKESVKISKELEKTHTVSTTITECREFAGDYSNDYVIFETILYDNYYYKILSHPNKTYVGKPMAISIPRDPAVYKWTVDYFNENNGKYPDIGDETFQHTIGEVWTYPTPGIVAQLEDEYSSKGFWKSDGIMTVGSGKGVNSVEIDLSRTETTETAKSFGVEYEAGFAIAGVGLSASMGLSTKRVYSVSIGESTKYRGDVGDIDPQDYTTYKYSVGLFVYNFYRPEDHMAYQVLNYWVQDYYGPLESTNTSASSSRVAGVEDFYKNPVVSDVVYGISNITGLSPQTVSIIIIAAGVIGIGSLAYIVLRKATKKPKKKTKRKHKK